MFLSVSPGFIKSLLSLGFWVPLSNISFACYLTHPVFILLYVGLQETPIHYSDINFVSMSERTFHSGPSILTLRFSQIVLCLLYSSDVPVPRPRGAHTGGELRANCAGGETLRPPQMEQCIADTKRHLQLTSLILYSVCLCLLSYHCCSILLL